MYMFLYVARLCTREMTNQRFEKIHTWPTTIDLFTPPLLMSHSQILITNLNDPSNCFRQSNNLFWASIKNISMSMEDSR